MAAPLSVQLEFGGGAELLFNGVKKHEVLLPTRDEPCDLLGAVVQERRGPAIVAPDGDIRNLLVWIKEHLLKERPELFVQGESVRPGILVLINDADWELMGELEYQLQDRDHVVFISTLHGG